MRFKRQLEEKTQMLQADLRKQKNELNQMKEQLNTLWDSKSQVRDQFYIQSTDTPVKLAAKEQDKNIESQGEKSQSVVPEDQQKQDVPPQTYSTDDYVLPASTSELESDSLETTQDYLQLWPKTSGPNNKSKYEVKSWPYISQDPEDSSEPRVTHYYSCHPVEVGQQELTPGEEKQETSNPQASQDTAEDPSEKIISYLSSDQSEAHE
uniref:Uncharacterized protein n=1 Tax=Myotis myotis TaxID=51298 RepID=A0A7J7YEF4_MYOMY|nr:hypothetical protein mMyoMyo1_010968 [Myotis myotis]